MSASELEGLKAVVNRHLEIHNRIPAEMALRLLEAIGQLERALSVPGAEFFAVTVPATERAWGRS